MNRLLRLLAVVFVFIPTHSYADSARELAYRLHVRLTAQNPSVAVWDQMADLIQRGNRNAAAGIAVANDSFINVIVRAYFAPMSSLSQNPVGDLNVIIATGMGVVRDDRPLTDLVTMNEHYQISDPTSTGIDITNYASNSNDHFINAEATRGLNIKRELVAVPNQGRGATYTDGAGLLTVDLEINNSFNMGTNRRGYQRAILNHFGKTLDEIRQPFQAIDGMRQDPVRRDVSRKNGGNIDLFKQECMTCHAHMDPATSAFNPYDFRNNPVFPADVNQLSRVNAPQKQQLTQQPVDLARDQNNNPTETAAGYVEVAHPAFELRNTLIGWQRRTGVGAREFGQAIAESPLFAENAVQRVWNLVCSHVELSDSAKQKHGKYFREVLGYRLPALFQHIASSAECLGDLN